MSNPDRRGKPVAFVRANSNDVDMTDIMSEVDSVLPRQRFKVAVDFGTTFSLVSYVALSENEDPEEVDPNRIHMIEQYRHAPSLFYESRREVPTESWYPEKPVRGRSLVNNSLQRRTDPAGENGLGNDGYMSNIIQERTGEHEADIELSDEQSEDENPEILEDYYWGYSVQHHFSLPGSNRDPTQRIKRSKLLLATSPCTTRVREDLRAPLEELRMRGLIREDVDVIADFLTCLFQHTKKQLTRSVGFHPGNPVEFVLCVPAQWSNKACRLMQMAMEISIEKSGFGVLQNGSIDNLFIVSEPEAAASCVLKDATDIMLGDTFVLLDAGGGTVDAITYTVDNAYPLRLKAEVVESNSALCGSSYLNERFQDLLLERLQGETYLEHGGVTIKGIVAEKVYEFENTTKRSINVVSGPVKEPIPISYLRHNKKKRFRLGRVDLSKDEWNRLFMPSLKRASELMNEQITLATQKGLAVKKVILIGGFAKSPSLADFLQGALNDISASLRRPIQFLCPEVPGSAVATGAILRALRKEDGPARIIQCSYGVLRTEPYDAEKFEGHRHASAYLEKLNGIQYAKDTIQWEIKKGREIPHSFEYPIPVVHIFPIGPKQDFLCAEILYVSDGRQESHFHKDHPHNQGMEEAGKIIVDMTFLRTQRLIRQIVPKKGEGGQRRYEVEFDLVIIVDGRNLRFEARYPRGPGYQVQGQDQICIAASFVPGTC